jgi:hypothetical protein
MPLKEGIGGGSRKDGSEREDGFMDNFVVFHTFLHK